MSQEQPTPKELEDVYRIAIAARDFEISQLVQRNNFFMVIQGVLLASLIQADGNGKIIPIVAFLVCLAGFLVSVLQIFMAAGAKFWQERWEYAVEIVEGKLFPNAEPLTNAELFRLFSSTRKATNAIVKRRMKGKHLVGWLVTCRFSPSRLPIYTAIVFAVIWLLLWLFTFTFSSEFAITGFPQGELIYHLIRRFQN